MAPKSSRRTTPTAPQEGRQASKAAPFLAIAAAVLIAGGALAYLGAYWYGPAEPPVDPAALQQRSENVRRAVAMLLQAQQKIASGQPTAALATAERAIALAPDLVIAHLVAGRAALEAKLHNRAREAFQKVLELEPGNPEALASLAAIALATGDRKTAQRNLREAARRFEQIGVRPSATFLVLQAAVLTDKPDEARNLLRQALSRDRQQAADALRKFAPNLIPSASEILAAGGHASEAADLLAHAAREGKWELADRAARLYQQAGNTQKALRLLEAAIKAGRADLASLREQILRSRSSQPAATSTGPASRPH